MEVLEAVEEGLGREGLLYICLSSIEPMNVVTLW